MNNDNLISALQKKIADKRSEMGKKPELNPITKCYMQMGTGERINLKTAPGDVLTSLLIDLNCRRMSAADLGIPYQIDEHSVEDWITDAKLFLMCQEYEQEKRRLKSLERQLVGLLSEEQTTERAIKAIAEKV